MTIPVAAETATDERRLYLAQPETPEASGIDCTQVMSGLALPVPAKQACSRVRLMRYHEQALNRAQIERSSQPRVSGYRCPAPALNPPPNRGDMELPRQQRGILWPGHF